MRAARIVGSALLVLAGVAAEAAGQDPATFFDDNCGMCHAIGGPPGGAPDLKDVSTRREHAWLVRFILNPAAVVKSDPDAARLVTQYDDMVMPATDGATAEMVERLLRYIDEKSGRAAAPAAAPAAVRAATADDVAAGRGWYEGRRALAHGAPACASCHRVDSLHWFGGGTLGPDLTRVHERLGGARGLSTWLANPPTRVMRAVFREQPLAGDETFALAAMLAAERPDPAPRARAGTRLFVAVGAGGALVAMALMAIVWSRRFAGVRRPLVAAARGRAGDHA